MAMPRDLVLVRHGQSEANIIQSNRREFPDVPAPEGFHDRHDSRMRLSALGVEQAIATGEWLRAEFPDGFDRYEVSALARTIETAGMLALNGNWRIDDRWRERDWGEYGVLSGAEQQTRFDISHRLKSASKWYWCPPGGESLATGVRLRFEDILETMHREMADKRVIAVTHGEMIEVARFVLERLLPAEWEAQEASKEFKLSNCQILHFTRQDPETGELSPRLGWRRSICAWDPSLSWNGGAWEPIGRREFTDAQLLELVSVYPRLLEEQ
jgi:broad specificity phosphatase PhoE